jgi:serine-type D-Ala-D-Ala carboxypeptidase/endopeptidase (penicillin-binding protein 4)
MKFLGILILFISITPVLCQESLQKVLNEIYVQPFYKHANLGISVREVKDGHLIAGIAKDKMMIPASTLKIITTLTARKKLGSDFRFETVLTYDGEISSDGILHGNIYIKGSGDPTLGGGRIPGNPNLKEWENNMVKAITLAGINCIEGDIVAITNSEDTPPIADSWQWHDLGNYYASGSFQLNVNENLYNIYYNRNLPLKEEAKISYIEPYIPLLDIKSQVVLDSSHTEDKAFIYGVPYTYQREVHGSIPKGKTLFKIKGAIPDPPMFLAYRLYNALGQSNVSGSHYRTQKEDIPVRETNLIVKHESPILAEIIKYANESSINLYTNALFERLGQSKSFKENAVVLKSILKNDGIDVTPLHIEDGSGLSARNLMSADFMAYFLSNQMKFLSYGDIPDIFSTAGVNGTVRNLLLKSPAKGKMWIKSGSMDKVLAYAGYCKTASGKLVAFSVMLNGSTAMTMRENKTELEKILDAIYRFS